MRRVIVIAAAGMSLAGCSTFSFDYFKSTPPTFQVQLDSAPQGADARTSMGPGCKTPCSVTITPPESNFFSVTYTLNKFLPTTIPVNVTRVPGDFTSPGTATFDPNPVFATLQPAGPPPKPPRKMHPKPKKPRPPAGAAAPPPAAGSPFPDAPPPAAAPPPR
jgi:hypothetical protein